MDQVLPGANAEQGKSTVCGFLFKDILWAGYTTMTGVPGLNGVPGCLTVSIILMGEKQSLMTKKPICRNDSGKESSHRWCTDLIRNRYFLGSLIQVSQLLQSKLFRNDHRWRSCIVRFWRTGGFRKSLSEWPKIFQVLRPYLSTLGLSMKRTQSTWHFWVRSIRAHSESWR